MSEIDDDDDGTDYFLTYTLRVSLVRIVGILAVPSNLKITAHIDRIEDTTNERVDIALSKIRYWFEHIVTKTVAFSRDNKVAIDMLIDDEGLPRLSNLFLLTPDEPRDEILGAVFQAKMNSLAAGAFFVEAVDVKSDNLDGLTFTLLGNHALLLPKTMEEWLGTNSSYFDVPWWLRDDASTMDAYVMGDSTKKPNWARKLDFFDKETKELSNSDDAEEPTVVQFKPTIISGGKDDSK